MSTKDYQEFTRTTAIYPREQALDYLILGLASEAGEVAGKRKKDIRDNGGNINVMSLIDEVGDVLWYVTRIADELNFSLDSVMQMNKQKLESRKQRNTLGGSGDVR